MDAPLPPGFAGWESPAPRRWWAEPKWIVVIVVVVVLAVALLAMMRRASSTTTDMNDDRVKQVVYNTLTEIQNNLEQQTPAPSYPPPARQDPQSIPEPVLAAPPTPPQQPPSFGEDVGMALREPDPPMRFGDDVPVTAERNSL